MVKQGFYKIPKRFIHFGGSLVVVFFVLIFVAWFTRAIWFYPYINNHAYNTYPHLLNIFYQRADEQVPANTILLIGDSHIQGLASSAIKFRSQNFGIGGDTVGGVSQRLAAMASLDKSTGVVLQVGYNDIGKLSAEQIVERYRALINKLSDKSVVATALFHVDENRLADKNRYIAEINLALEQLAVQHPNLTLININSLLTQNGSLKPEMHVGDGLHLSLKGYRIWTKAINSELEKVIGQTNEN